MTFAIPIFVEERSGSDKPPMFIVRPVYLAEPVQRGEKLSRALAKLTNDLHQLLHGLSHEPRHDDLAKWTLPVPLEETTLELRLELGSASHLRRFFLVGYPALGRKLYFTPSLPGLHFEVLTGQSLSERAATVLTRHLRAMEKEGFEVDLDELALAGRARLMTIDITLHPATVAKKAKKPTRAQLFGSEETKDGAQELRKTGRLLQSMYPDDLDRALGRDHEVESLARLLGASDRRPVLMVGPRKVGKTTILHELVWRMCARKKERYGGGREIWLVSPMRLISGMSFLGEWESRVLAILDHAGSTDRVLCFDDLPGLFTAGVSCASDLNVAQVLRPALEKRAVRVIAEITPEAWRVLRERDRAFADLFHVIPVHEPPESETLRVLINVARQLEEQHRCHFDLDVVPAACELHRRFAADAAFPGKAAGFLRRLAVRHAGGQVGRQAALEEFREQSGLQLALLDDRAKLQRHTILEALRARVVGQDDALGAFADILVTLKARLNDPRRPLGTLLLLGPTGVGKTQAAKTLAAHLFGSAERLLRFDMNEFVDGASASRLTGTPRDPEGLLSSAIRRQPFSVVLFDEIEKAAPEVFDLLLAVLDEGRLTDALGRVADFTQSVILLTSNLGVREARARLGFAADVAGSEADDAIYVGAAERFFRPEFFNRLDRILPFRALGPAQLEGIARQLISDVFAREGLRRRECLLNVAPEAMARLVALGHSPQLGARALKRVVEREVAQPLAEKLAASPPGLPTIATFGIEQDAFVLRFRELTPVARSVFWTETATQAQTPVARPAWIEQILAGAYSALDRIEACLEASAPAGRIELGNVPPQQARYFFCREQWKKVERVAGAVERAREASRRPAGPAKTSKARPTKVVLRQFYSGTPRFDREREAIALRQDLADLEPDPVAVPDSPVTALLRELALLEVMAADPPDDRPALLLFRARDEADAAAVFQLAGLYHGFFEQYWGATAAYQFLQKNPSDLLVASIFGEPRSRIQGLYLTGPNLRRLLPAGHGTILSRQPDGRLGIVLMTVNDAGSAHEATLLARSAETRDTVDAEAFGPVVQMLHANKTMTDFRTGLVIPSEPSVEEFRALLLSALPLPAEVSSLVCQRLVERDE